MHVKKPDGKAHEKGILLSSFLSPKLMRLDEKRGEEGGEGAPKRKPKLALLTSTPRLKLWRRRGRKKERGKSLLQESGCKRGFGEEGFNRLSQLNHEG